MSLNADTDAALLIDAENAFNSIHCKIILHNLKFTCPIIAITKSIVMQLNQGYLLPVGKRHFLMRGQLKVTQQLWKHMH